MKDEEVWDSMDYPINLSYREQWDTWEAVREIVQNALDAGEKENIELKKEDGDLVVSDTGEGMEVRHLVLGVSDKGEDDRGQFGEGLKIAFIVLQRLGYDVRIESGNLVIETDTTDIGGEECLQLHYKTEDEQVFDGTKVIVNDYDGNLYEDRFIGIDGEDEDTIYSTEYGDIVDRSGRIFVRDMYVDTYDTMRFGYNFNNLELSEDRSIAGEYSLKNNMKRIWGCVEDKELWDELFEVIKDESSYESRITWSGRYVDGKIRDLVRESFNEIFGSITGKEPVLETDDSLSREAEWRGANVVDGRSLRDMKSILPTDEEYVREYDSANDVEVSEDKLNDTQRYNLRRLREYIELYYERYTYELQPDIKPYKLKNSNNTGKMVGDEIWIDIEKLKTADGSMSTMIHEMAHDLFDVDDKSEEQIDKIQEIGSKMVRLAEENTLTYTH